MQNNFEREEFQAPLSEINMTPLVDIMLVLLVIFLIAAPILNSSIQLNLPKESAPQISQENPVNISITKRGEYFLEQKKLEISDLESHLRSIARENSKTQIHISADVDVAYGKVSKILAIAQNLGLKDVGFVTKSE